MTGKKLPKWSKAASRKRSVAKKPPFYIQMFDSIWKIAIAVLTAIAIGVFVPMVQKSTGTAPSTQPATPKPSPPARSASKSETTTKSSRPSIKVDVAQPEPDDSQMGVVFPADIRLAPTDLRFINSGKATDQWLRARGAVDMEFVSIKLVLEGNLDGGVRIIGVRPIKTCTAPLSGGTLLYSPPAGEDPSVQIGINLDRSNPTAQKIHNFEWGSDYFSGSTVFLKKGEQKTFQVYVRTISSYCTFSLELSTLGDGIRHTQVVTNNGVQFKVTSMTGPFVKPFRKGIPVSREIKFSDYSKVYAGPTAPPPHGKPLFISVNPQTYVG